MFRNADEYDDSDFHNGYLFNRLRTQTALPKNPVAFPFDFQYHPRQYMFAPQPQSNHRRSPVPNHHGENSSSESVDSTSSEAGKNGTSAVSTSRCNWIYAKSKFVIESIKHHYAQLGGTSSAGKQLVWESIFAEFQALCAENSVVSNKNANQVKEKWRTLLDRYKHVSDHNKLLNSTVI